MLKAVFLKISGAPQRLRWPQASGVLLCPSRHVKFGEVALQPPELTAKPRKSMSPGQPGKKSLM